MLREQWKELPGDRSASSLGREHRRQRGVRGFVVLGPASEPGRLRPTVAYGVVRGDQIEVQHGLLSLQDLETLRAFWGLRAELPRPQLRAE